MINIAIIIHSSLATMIRCSLAIALLLSLLVSIVNAQSTSLTDGSTPFGTAPGAPAGSYALSGFDNINFYNGNLNFRLPLLQMGGRGAAQYIMMLPIEQRWRVVTNAADNGQYIEYISYPEANWWNGLEPGYGPGVLQGRQVSDFPNACGHNGVTLTRLTFTASDGTEYELRDQATGGEPKQIQCFQSFSRGNVFITADGTAATFISDSTIYDTYDGSFPNLIYPLGYLILRDGTRYRIDNGRVSWIRDRNGNRLSFTYDSSSRVTSVTDSLNRQVTIAYDVSDVPPYGLCDQISFKGFGGAQRMIRISKTNLQYALRSGYSLQTYAALFPELNGASSSTNHNPTVISSVWLPDGRRYQFFYNSYGELARVVLPTGGAFEYDHTPGSSVYAVDTELEIYRRVVERRVYPDGTTLESKMTISNFETSNPALTTVTVDHLNLGGTLLLREKHYYNGSALASLGQRPLSYSFWKDGKEYQTEYINSNGTTVLRRGSETWQQRAPVSWWNNWWNTYQQGAEPSNDPRITETVSTLVDTNQVAKQTFTYDDYNNKTNVYEYDFGSGAAGPLVRRTETVYLTINNGYNYQTDTNIHLRSLPVRQSVYDASGIERAQTTYQYDNYTADGSNAPLTDRPGISGFDSGFTTSYLIRGNVTRVSRRLISSGIDLSTYQNYDIAGNVVKIKDPRGNWTTLEYSDRFGSPDGEARSNSAPAPLSGQTSYAFATKVTNPLGHTTYTQFDYYIGRAVDFEDQNGTVTSGYYSDALDRPTQVILGVNRGDPYRSRTLFTYSDSIRKITTNSDLVNYTDGQLTTDLTYDGLGRTVETRSYEGSGWMITSQVTYDAMGRVSRSYNPYRSTIDSSYGYSQTSYDALSRVISVTSRDINGVSSGTVQTSYSGNQTTVTDQAGKVRRSTTDALGRLVQVVEDPNWLAYLTRSSLINSI